jgi:PEP-CTERM motif
MNILLSYQRLGLALVIWVATLSIQEESDAMTIHFGDHAEGALVSAANPFSDILNLQAAGGTDYVTNGFTTSQGRGTSPFWTESMINAGVLEVKSTGEVPANCYALKHRSRLTADFALPVVDVSFAAFCYRPAVYSFSGFDGANNPFSGGGAILGVYDGVPYGTRTTFALEIPDGGFLTEFHVTNNDETPGNGAFWISDITFSTVSTIPEPSALGLLTIGVAGYLFFRRITPPPWGNTSDVTMQQR